MTSLLEGALAAAGFTRHASALAKLAVPSARMRIASTPDRDIPSATSKLGGSPDVPGTFDWPTWRGQPLAFIGQINLRDIATVAGVGDRFPASGLLSFFYHPAQTAWGFDPKDKGSARVYWFREDSAYSRTALPAALPDHGRFSSGRMTLREHMSLAPSVAISVKALDLSEEEQEHYSQFCTQWDERSGVAPQHQVLGHPAPIQDEMQLEVQLASNGIYVGDPSGYADPRCAALEPHATDWLLLAQIDSDEDAGMMWGDLGMLYFWIRDTDLREHRFDQAWLILQCF